MDFDTSNNSIDYTGGQLALYGGYDDEIQYARGIAAFGFYSGDSTRRVTVAPGDTVSTLNGDPDSNVFSISGEIGKRFAMGGGMMSTPFAGARLVQEHQRLHRGRSGRLGRSPRRRGFRWQLHRHDPGRQGVGPVGHGLRHECGQISVAWMRKNSATASSR